MGAWCVVRGASIIAWLSAGYNVARQFQGLGAGYWYLILGILGSAKDGRTTQYPLPNIKYQHKART
jgi:hypothetical protein